VLKVCWMCLRRWWAPDITEFTGDPCKSGENSTSRGLTYFFYPPVPHNNLWCQETRIRHPRTCKENNHKCLSDDRDRRYYLPIWQWDPYHNFRHSCALIHFCSWYIDTSNDLDRQALDTLWNYRQELVWNY